MIELAGIYEYTVDHYRALHQIPEVGFDLPKTARYVTDALLALGIEPQQQYGQCSVVAQIGNDPNRPTIGFRADMDALPISEETNLPHSSRHPGAMHACGHDSHTAILLGVAKYLKAHEDKLSCNVRLFFQPSEEGAVSGAKMMVDNGAMEGVSCAICTHCEPTVPTGKVGLCIGDSMAACIPMELRFHGKSAHATLPHQGIHALDMAVDAYRELKEMVALEAGERKYIWNVGHMAAGDVHNIIPDLTVMRISFRFYDIPFSLRVMEKVEAICNRIANSYGGSVELDWRMSTGPVYNDPAVCDQVLKAMEGLEVLPFSAKLSSEDFAWFLTKAPGLLFRYGIGNEAEGITEVAHNCRFRIDEPGMKTALQTFIQFALNYNQQ